MFYFLAARNGSVVMGLGNELDPTQVGKDLSSSM